MFWYIVCNCVSDINECEGSNPCHQYQICNNTNGGYNCTCWKGYEPIHEENGKGDRTVLTGCQRIPGNQLMKTSIIALCKYNNIYKNCIIIIIIIIIIINLLSNLGKVIVYSRVSWMCTPSSHMNGESH